jgi:hypothetical protein
VKFCRFTYFGYSVNGEKQVLFARNTAFVIHFVYLFATWHTLFRFALYTPKNIIKIRSTWRGGRARFNAPDLKSGEGSNLPGVRIPPSPPSSENPHTVAGFFMVKRKVKAYMRGRVRTPVFDKMAG